MLFHAVLLSHILYKKDELRLCKQTVSIAYERLTSIHMRRCLPWQRETRARRPSIFGRIPEERETGEK